MMQSNEIYFTNNEEQLEALQEEAQKERQVYKKSLSKEHADKLTLIESVSEQLEKAGIRFSLHAHTGEDELKIYWFHKMTYKEACSQEGLDEFGKFQRLITHRMMNSVNATSSDKIRFMVFLNGELYSKYCEGKCINCQK